jgi:hypothetical protein
MSESDLSYDDVEVDVGSEEVLDVDTEHETTEAEAPEVDQKGKDEPKPKVSNYVDFDRDLNEQKDVIKGRIGEYHRVSMTTQRELEMVKAEKAELEKKIGEFSKQKAPEAPSIDLAIENPSEFERQQRQYLEHETSQRLIQEQQKANEEREKAVRSQEIHERSVKILEDAKTKGIDEKMVEAGAVFLAQTGMMDALKGEILGNPNAAEILSLIATDEEMAAELFYKLRSDPVDARVFLRTDLKAKALSKFVKKPSAPKPTTKVSGSRGPGKTVNDRYSFDVE